MILTGADQKAFCVGADLKDLKAMSRDETTAWCMLGSNVFNTIARVAKPVVAAINGYALGGGLELALACDFRIAAENASLGLPEVTLGWLPGWGGVKRLVELIGPTRAKEMLMFGSRIKAAEAMSIGLLNRVVPQDRLMAVAGEFAGELCEKNPMSLSAIKLMIQEHSGRVDSRDSLLEAMSVSSLSKSDYALEKIAAFENKSRPK
ncbi:MAG: enoyl-CoA hydratase/isomerase family protein [Desulfobacterales bacterium]|jgi:enoyl-CoA hydratase/carnithine racemase